MNRRGHARTAAAQHLCWYVLAFMVCWHSSALRAEPPPVVGPERIVLRTVGGDIVLALYPQVAPRTVAQVLRLARLGVYDTTHFSHVDPFAVQLSVVQDRHTQLAAEQRAALQPIPAEFTDTVKHRAGAVFMVRGDAPDSAETVFAILVRDAPHLDGDYTVFGYVESGFDVVEAFTHVRRDAMDRPLARLTIEQAAVVDSPAGLAQLSLRGPIPIRDPYEVDAAVQPLHNMLTAALMAIVAIALASFACLPKLSSRHVQSLSLLQMLIGMFMIFMLQVPTAQHLPLLGAVLFAALIGLFKLMSRFEASLPGEE